jgi:hypothetical protein
MKPKNKTKKTKKKPSKAKLASLQAQFDQLMAQTATSNNFYIRENARVLQERMDELKAGKITPDEVLATIGIQQDTIQAVANLAAQGSQTPAGDPTPQVHETEIALDLLKLAATLAPLFL